MCNNIDNGVNKMILNIYHQLFKNLWYAFCGSC